MTEEKDENMRDERGPVIPDGMQEMYDSWHIAPAFRAGDFVFCSGVLGTGPDGKVLADPDEQFDAVFRNLGHVLSAAGADLSHIVEVVAFHIDLEGDIAAFSEAKERYMSEPYPAWTAVDVSRLGGGEMAGARVEVKATAYLGG